MRTQINSTRRLKAFFLAALLLSCSACGGSASAGGSPTAAVERFNAAMSGGDVKGIVRAYSSDWIKRNGGTDKALKNTELVVALARDNIKRSGHAPELHNVKEIIDGDKADVSFEQGAPDEAGGFPAVIHLVREDGEWKIDDADISTR